MVENIKQRTHYYLQMTNKLTSMEQSPSSEGKNGKGKVIPLLSTEHHSIEAYGGNRGIVSRILDLDTRWR
jgi:hypothetical protein